MSCLRKIADEHQLVGRAQVAIERQQHLARRQRGPLHDRHRRGQRRFGRVEIVAAAEQLAEPQQRRGRQRVAAGRAAVGQLLGARDAVASWSSAV